VAQLRHLFEKRHRRRREQRLQIVEPQPRVHPPERAAHVRRRPRVQRLPRLIEIVSLPDFGEVHAPASVRNAVSGEVACATGFAEVDANPDS